MKTHLRGCLLVCVAATILLTTPGIAADATVNNFLSGSAATAEPARLGTAGAGSAAGVLRAPAAIAPVQDMPQTYDYSQNAASDVFGAHLFTGSFARPGATQFNPDYVVAIGDQLQIRLWGGFTLDTTFVVDPQGNIFLPHVGPVKVLGVRNQQLQETVDRAVRRVFSANVYSYASLAAAQPVRVFVGGFVNRPGLYNGTSMDSLLHYLDQAGGIDLDRGSMLAVQVKRGADVRAEINLYDFLLAGRIPLVQFADGDVIFVSPRRNSVAVRGLVRNANRFEFVADSLDVAAISALAKPMSQATHVRVVRNTGTTRNTEYFPLADAAGVAVMSGDEVEFTADKRPGTITIRVEGEHLSPQEYVLPYGSRMGDLLKQVKMSELADADNIQLFRDSVRTRQKALIETSLRSLEAAALTARSGTSDEARLRADEAALILQWVDRARRVQPTGQVYIGGTGQRDQLLLESGDVIRVPKLDGLVLVSGEVLFPNAVAFDDDASLRDYIQRAGGYTQNADVSRVIVARVDGSFEEARKRSWLFGSEPRNIPVHTGDQVLVLPRIDIKARQITKDLTQIIYQLAVSAKVILDL